MENKELLTRKEAAEFLSISLSTLKNWTYDKLIKAYKLGGRIYYKRKELINSLREVN
ncbi:MAG: helix-turn-helix domain-containing protein [Flavobacteriales bacterium]|jgi:excisionase family DNA binding protein|nr:helix-turn-helix domain-containing protein [Flavobacteriales bacterium]